MKKPTVEDVVKGVGRREGGAAAIEAIQDQMQRYSESMLSWSKSSSITPHQARKRIAEFEESIYAFRIAIECVEEACSVAREDMRLKQVTIKTTTKATYSTTLWFKKGDR